MRRLKTVTVLLFWLSLIGAVVTYIVMSVFDAAASSERRQLGSIKHTWGMGTGSESSLRGYETGQSTARIALIVLSVLTALFGIAWPVVANLGRW